MREKSSSRKSSRGRSCNRSRNGRRKGSKGPRSCTRDPNRCGQEGKDIQTAHEATYPESGTHHQRVAVCHMWTNELDDTQGVSPVPQATPRSIQPDGLQGDAIRVHGEPNTQIGQSAREVTPSTLPPETRPGVRVVQATARLARAQKLKVELEEKLFEVEAAVQDKLTQIALATAELENAKRALIPSAPTTDPGSACITFSRAVCRAPRVFACLSEKAWPAIPKERKEQNGGGQKDTRPHDTRGCRHNTQACQLVGWVGEKLAAPNPPPPRGATLPDTTLPIGQGAAAAVG